MQLLKGNVSPIRSSGTCCSHPKPVSYGSISEMSSIHQQPLQHDEKAAHAPEAMEVADDTTTTTATLTTRNRQPHHRQNLHERKSTNTDIASIVHRTMLHHLQHGSDNDVAMGTSTASATVTSRPLRNTSYDNDDDDDNDHLLTRLNGATTATTISSFTMIRETLPLPRSSDTEQNVDVEADGGCCCSTMMKRFCRRSSSETNRTSGIGSSTFRSHSIPIATGATLNLCSATLGAGILALPYTLYQSGFVVGGILLLLAAIATERSIYVLIHVIQTYPTAGTSYESMTEHVLDHRLDPSSTLSSIPSLRSCLLSYRATVEIAMLLFCGGCAVGYIIAIGDILEEFDLLFVNENRHYTIIVVWFLAMVPLSLLRNVQSLQYASAVGITAIGTLIVAAYVHYVQHHPSPHHHNDYGTNSPVMDDWRNMGSSDHDTVTMMMKKFLWPVNGWVSILTAGPVVLFAFSCQPNVCAIYDELKVHTNSHHQDNDEIDSTTAALGTKKLRLMHCVTIAAVGICAVLYCSISVIALGDFGDKVLPNMLSCYSSDHSSHLIQIATAAMALAIVMAFPLNIFPARVTLIGLWHKYKRRRHHQSYTSDQVISLHTIGPHVGLTAALLQDEDEGESPSPDIFHGHHVTINSSGNNNGIESDETPLQYRNHVSDGPNALDNIAVDSQFSPTLHIVSTLFLTTVTLVFALILPNISVVFGLLGGTASSWLGFCVPGLLGIQLSKNKRSNGEQPVSGMLVTSWALLIGGIIVGVFTTCVTIYNTAIPVHETS
jgi:amino acid permease